MSKQKSMGEVLCGILCGPRYWRKIPHETQQRYVENANSLIAEHERRKRAKVKGKRRGSK